MWNQLNFLSRIRNFSLEYFVQLFFVIIICGKQKGPQGDLYLNPWVS